MLAQAWRSTDGGALWSRLHTPGLANAATIAPATATTAVLNANAGGARVLRTTDAGRSWRPVTTPRGPVYARAVIFTGPRVGTAILQASGPAAHARVWRTVDGGDHWVPLRIG
jgi:photosystem II stability/assembly factor-like uncharacterized protein